MRADKQGVLPIMQFVLNVRKTVTILAAATFVAFSSGVMAQEITEAHLKAARAAVAAVKATDAYDNILPAANIALKQQLIQQNPDLQELIIAAVDQKTLEMVSRRADLEKEVALSYARVFSEADLNSIAAFYSSASGQKLLSEGPIVAREVAKAAEIWQRGISRDLTDAVGKQLAAEVEAQVKADAAAAPAPAPAPADDAGAPQAPAPADDAAAPQEESPELKGLDAPVQ